MVMRDASGKVVRLGGFLDIIGLRVAPAIDDETWPRIAPLIDEWVTDTDRSVIDNLDFVEELDAGVLSRLNLMDGQANRRVMEMVMQFVAIGPLAQYLETKGGLTRAQGQQVTSIVNEYHQQLLNEVQAAAKAEAAGLPPKEREEKEVHATSRFIFTLMARDALASYYRQLDELAPNLGKIVAGLDLESVPKATVERAVQSLSSARGVEEQRKIVKAALSALSFDQRRQVLMKARELAPKLDARTAYASEVEALKSMPADGK
jgi:hypothetical protein